MKLPDGWCPWVLGLLLVLSVVLALVAHESDDRAERADARADSLAEIAARPSPAEDSLRTVVDSLEASLDSTERREDQVRDSLGRELELARRDVEVAESLAFEADSQEALAHRELLERVRPELVPVVRRAIRWDSAGDTNRDRIQRGQAAMLALVRDSAASIGRENRELRSTLEGVREQRDTLDARLNGPDGARAALAAMTEARDEWRRAARKPWWAAIVGDGVLEAAGTVGSAVAAQQVGEKALVGWTIAKGADFVVWSLTRD